MNVYDFHDQRVRQAGFRGVLIYGGLLAATVAAGVSLLTAPVEVVASGSQDKQKVSTEQISQLRHQVDDQAEDLAELRAILETCFTPASVCAPVPAEPLLVSRPSTVVGSSGRDNDDDGDDTTVVVREQPVKVEQPDKNNSDDADKKPSPEPSKANSVKQTTDVVKDTVQGVLDTASKASSKARGGHQ